MKLAIIALIALFMTGCVHYEYDLVKPASVAGHVSSGKELVIKMDPLEYRLMAPENHLVMRVFNPTPQPVELIGPQSAAIDPHGQAHPLPSQTIYPGSYIKLIFPPPTAEVVQYGPTWGVGVGYYHRIGYRREYGLMPMYEPVQYVVYPAESPYYWDWSGESDARIALVFQHAGKTFRDEFVFHRVKM